MPIHTIETKYFKELSSGSKQVAIDEIRKSRKLIPDDWSKDIEEKFIEEVAKAGIHIERDSIHYDMDKGSAAFYGNFELTGVEGSEFRDNLVKEVDYHISRLMGKVVMRGMITQGAYVEADANSMLPIYSVNIENNNGVLEMIGDSSSDEEAYRFSLIIKLMERLAGILRDDLIINWDNLNSKSFITEKMSESMEIEFWDDGSLYQGI